MESKDFPGAYLKIGGNQTDVYNVIHAMPIEGVERQIVAIFQLTDEEVDQIVKTKTLFYTRLTFGELFQPMRISTEPIKISVSLVYPEGPPVTVEAEVGVDGVHIPGYKKTEDGKYVKLESGE